MNAPDLSMLNQRALETRLRRLAKRLESWPEIPDEDHAPTEPVPALDLLRDSFGLSDFESGVLLLTAGCELSSEVARLCSAITGTHGASFGLCLAALPGAHWDAITPLRPLRRWRLVEIGDERSLTRPVLRIPERVLHFITGINYPDPQIAVLMAPVASAATLPDSYHALAGETARRMERTIERPPCIQIVGDQPQAALQLAGEMAEAIGLGLLPLDGARLAGWSDDVHGLCRLIERECLLLPAMPVIEWDGAGLEHIVRCVMEELSIRLLVVGRAALQCRRANRTVRLARPGADERERLWRAALGPALANTLNGELELVASQFPLGAHEINAAGAQIRERIGEGETWRTAVSAVCRAIASPRLDELAERIETRADWNDLVLPQAQRDVLAQIIAQVRARRRVYGEWGFGARLARGLGVSVLFSGESGTGKTLAAEVVAGELGLDLYRIDLSGVVSKYIGETEKNLARVFSAAEDSGAVLLFDEADALFGKRSEVKDSHDRYANIEVSYLLQRMEAYSGLAILTTNQRTALDHAFERRLRFIVNFPFPDVQQREAIWRKTFPAEMPLGDISFSRLAQLHVTGGVIRNIALNAAFLAADADRPLGMAELAQAARAEIAKAERPTGEAQIRSWL